MCFGYVLWGFQCCPLELAWVSRAMINGHLLAGCMSFITTRSTLESILEAMIQPCAWGGDNLFPLCLICTFTPNHLLMKFMNVHSCYIKIPHFKYCCLNYKVKQQNVGKRLKHVAANLIWLPYDYIKVHFLILWSLVLLPFRTSQTWRDCYGSRQISLVAWNCFHSQNFRENYCFYFHSLKKAFWSR